MQLTDIHTLRKYAAAATALFAFACVVKDSTADEIYSPNAEYREFSLEYNGSRTFDRNPDKDGAQTGEASLEAGLTRQLEVEVSAVSAKDPGGTSQLAAREIEGRYQFFDPEKSGWMQGCWLPMIFPRKMACRIPSRSSCCCRRMSANSPARPISVLPKMSVRIPHTLAARTTSFSGIHVIAIALVFNPA